MQLVIITKNFPFNNGEAPGETFLDSEIKVLSERIALFLCFFIVILTKFQNCATIIALHKLHKFDYKGKILW